MRAVGQKVVLYQPTTDMSMCEAAGYIVQSLSRKIRPWGSFAVRARTILKTVGCHLPLTPQLRGSIIQQGRRKGRLQTLTFPNAYY